eukprot:TRINITY_DN724_c1_g1_i1.p1 TRINITY_DN724_c1_g1~~TRINITY_DN724_c1_g1_i1.p1  ORF type:complete len:464 (+),score=112.98 TRINITY_DN724_c1_g1_i1:38-1393(+)
MSDLRRRKANSEAGSDEEGVLVDKPAEIQVFHKENEEEEEEEAAPSRNEPFEEPTQPTIEEPEQHEEPEGEPQPPVVDEPEPVSDLQPEAPQSPVMTETPVESPQESSVLSGKSFEKDASRRSVTAPAPRHQEDTTDDDELASTLGKVMMRKVVDRYPFLEDVFKKMVPVIEKVNEGIDKVGPHVMKGYEKARVVYQNCPWEIILSLVGLVLCFFGGAFVTLIAAAEAFRLCGGTRTMRHLRELHRDYLRVRLATRKNQLLKPDTKLKPHDYVVVAFKSVRDPQRLSASVSGVYTAVLAVFATLRMQFARTITLGSSIGDFIKTPVIRYTKPSLEYVIADPDYIKWIPTLLEWLCRFIGVTIAWYAQRMNAALQSSLRGGSMCVKHAAQYLRSVKHIPTTQHDESIETGLGYLLALCGLYCQIYWGFSVPFPLNILVLPLSILESFLLFFM